jgi:hypothetical protein
MLLLTPGARPGENQEGEMRRKITALLLAAFFLLAVASPAFAGNTGYEGQPGNQSSGGGNTGYEGQPGNQGGH